MSALNSYIVIFKKEAPQSEIDSQIEEVQSKGGKVTQKYDSSIMRGFAATMPEAHAQSLTSASEGGKHPHVEYVEPDQKMSTQ